MSLLRFMTCPSADCALQSNIFGPLRADRDASDGLHDRPSGAATGEWFTSTFASQGHGVRDAKVRARLAGRFNLRMTEVRR